jgi:hypothetical protein
MTMKNVRTPFSNMSFTPDVPSSSLTATEYNSGQNVETDVRSIKSVLGEQYILSQIPGKPIFVTSGFRANNVYWFIVATSTGVWYAIDDAGITNISSAAVGYTSAGYNDYTSITATWNGTVLFINDTINPPMYLLDSVNTLRLYDNAPDNYVWNYSVTVPTSGAQSGNTIPLYSSLTAGFIRLYNSPNVGSLLFAGNLSGVYAANVTVGTPGTIQNLPTTVQWSQNFGLNAGPTTWAPTLTNVANQVDIPVRGPVIDGFPLNGNFYVCSYWDTVVFSPIAYQSSTAPLFGIKLINQGRGLLNENCWTNVDNVVFGMDARDIWSFDGGTFKAIGNQRVKNYLYSNLNPNYTGQIFMDNNSSKYQIEIYYPDLTSTGHCNKMISYRYDLDVWNPPRDVNNATMSTESPVWTANVPNYATRTIVYTSFDANTRMIQKDIGTSFVNNAPISTSLQRNNISYGQNFADHVLVHRVLPEVYGTGNVTYAVGGSMNTNTAPVFQPNVNVAIGTDYPWAQINQNEQRMVALRVTSNSAVNSWQLSSMNWQVTVVETDR